MHLEKATYGSGQAATVGWISSNDVALFTTVLFLAIAIFLHSRFTAGAKENALITQEKAALSGNLAAAASELDEFRDLLEKNREALSLTQEERDQLRQQLVEKLAAIAELNAKLDVLLGEKGELESQQQSLAAAQESLSKENLAIAGDRDSLKKSNLSLREQLDLIAQQLEAKIAALEKLARERDRLKSQAGELDSAVATLQQKSDELESDLGKSRRQAASRIEELETQLAARDKSIDDYSARLNRAAKSYQGLQAEKQQLQRTLSERELRRQRELEEEARNNRALVGLTGKLDRVAVLFDASGSMRQSTATGGDRWAKAQQIAATWLKHLSVKECVLIVYSSEVSVFPNDGSLTDLRGAGGQARRDALLQHVKTVSPAGWTNTYDALRAAYRYDIDAVLLFSDGAPSQPTTGVFDPAAARQIYDLCRTKRDIPIHTIGLGNYFDQNASTFLMSVAAITNGTFRGN